MIIGIAGKCRSGKTELAKVCEKYGYERLYFALPLKRLCADLLDTSIDELNRAKAEKYDIGVTVGKDMCEIISEETDISNYVELDGFICKEPKYRITPFNRKITDLLVAVNRTYHNSDYIPCIAWGRNARFCENIEVGTEVRIIGRVQSRQYEKKYEDEESQIEVGALPNDVIYDFINSVMRCKIFKGS